MAVTGDNPIKAPAEDRLGRAATAKNLASEVRSLDASDGYVIAVMGAWGSGKTSLVNMMRSQLDASPALPVVDFNPWMFSGADQLVDAFFIELSAQLRVKQGRVGQIAGEIEAYSELLSPLSVLPFLGSWIDRVRGASGAIRKFQERRRESVTARRATLSAKLAELEAPVVVVIDDIDRLQTDEIRDIFKLVRLTASFPNIVYVLAFDRRRVEDALTERGIEGRSYLEKIVQIAVDVPAVPEEALLKQVGEALDGALADVGAVEPFDEDRWPDVLMEVVRPLIRNMRDVRRYAASVRGTARALRGEIELVDLLALEAIRVFLPDTFDAVTKTQRELTETFSSFGSRRDDPALKESVVRLVEAAGEHENVARALVRRVFPAGLRYIENNHYGPEWLKTWLRARRAAHVDILRLYLERVAGEGLVAFTDAERAYAVLADRQQLEKHLRSIDLARLQDVIAALENYDGEYPVESVEPATITLLNLMPELPDRPRGMLTLVDTRLVVTRVILRLLRQLPGSQEVEAAIQDVLPEIRTMSSKLLLVNLVGHRDGVGHGLVSEEAAQELERNLESQVRAATAEQLLLEWDLLRLVLAPRLWNPDSDFRLDPARSSDLNAKMLDDSRDTVRTQAMDSRAVRRKTRLAWDVLETVYGGEDSIRSAVESVRSRSQSDPRLAETVELADKYLSGWRPQRFEDED